MRKGIEWFLCGCNPFMQLAGGQTMAYTVKKPLSNASRLFNLKNHSPKFVIPFIQNTGNCTRLKFLFHWQQGLLTGFYFHCLSFAVQ